MSWPVFALVCLAVLLALALGFAIGFVYSLSTLIDIAKPSRKHTPTDG